MITELEIARWIVFGLMAAAVWFLKRTQESNEAKIKATEERIHELEKATQEIKADYLHKSDFKDFKSELRSMFEEIRQDIRSLQKTA